jgi:FixJ family two-component response regulator
MMPGPLNGKNLADAVVQRWPKTKVVFMSGYTQDAIAHHGQLDAGVLLLNKPFRKSDLAQILRQALDGPGDPREHTNRPPGDD